MVIVVLIDGGKLVLDLKNAWAKAMNDSLETCPCEAMFFIFAKNYLEMKAIDANANLVNFYFDLLANLTVDVKIELISKLLATMKTENGKKEEKKKSILDFSGAWVSDKSAEELIEEIRGARLFNRQIEPL